MQKTTRRRSTRSRTARAKKAAIAKGTAWIFAALVVGLIDLRFLAIPPLGIAGMAIAAYMGIIGLRHIRRGKRLGPHDLLGLASEKEAGLLNIATIVEAFRCAPAVAYTTMEEGVKGRLFEDVTPPGGKTFIIRSLASDDLTHDVEEGREAMERAMQKLEADLSGNPVAQELEAQLEAARSSEGTRDVGTEPTRDRD